MQGKREVQSHFTLYLSCFSLVRNSSLDSLCLSSRFGYVYYLFVLCFASLMCQSWFMSFLIIMLCLLVFHLFVIMRNNNLCAHLVALALFFSLVDPNLCAFYLFRFLPYSHVMAITMSTLYVVTCQLLWD